jgi:hypothetical protein
MARADGAPSSGRRWLGSTPESPPVAAREARRLPTGRLLLVALAILAGLVLWKVPEWQVAPERYRLAAAPDLSTSDRLLLEKELFQAENAARGTLALILAAAGLLLGLGVAWRRFEIIRQARSQERFAQAVEQLASERADGSPRTETRLGGIYALERIAADSEAEYWPVMEVLTAYLRERALRSLAAASDGASPVRPGADVQAIIGVLGRRRAGAPAGERRLLDLQRGPQRC